MQGFSLIELAVSLLVLSLLIIGLFVPISTQLEQRNSARTQDSMEEIRHALYGFAMANGRLPQPALTTKDGIESAMTCTHHLVCVGYLPWASLGVAPTDAWGKHFVYGVTRKFSVQDPSFSFADSGVWTIETRDPEDPTKFATQATKVVAVILSHGAKNFGRTPDGVNLPNTAPEPKNPTNIDEIFNARIIDDLRENPDQSPIVRHRGVSTSNVPATGGQFDDMVLWIPTSLFMNRMVDAKRLP